MNKHYASDDKLNWCSIVERAGDKPTLITIEDCDTLAAAKKFSNPCCLNFASHKRPGGGYKAVINIPLPIKTQEEDLFRRSNLPELMDIPEVRKWYPLHGLSGIYTNQVVICKDAKLQPCEPFNISLVTVPAVVNPHTIEHMQLVKNKAYRILEIAADNEHKDLILGAWGCGVFNNDPTNIAELFCSIIRSDFRNIFDNVIFAIPGKNSNNYRCFEERIGFYQANGGQKVV